MPRTTENILSFNPAEWKTTWPEKKMFKNCNNLLNTSFSKNLSKENNHLCTDITTNLYLFNNVNFSEKCLTLTTKLTL